MQEAATETTTVQHVPLALETVKRRADYVLHTSWRLLPAHIIPPEANYQHVGRPQCIIKALDEASAGWTELSLEGIPYCTGGMNGYETFVQNKYKKTSLYEVLGMTSQYGVLYCVGNILKTYVNENGHRTIVPDTVGVDCSGFVGSTCGISTKLNCEDLAEYGHEVASSNIQPFDIIIEDIHGDGYYDHCYFYKGAVSGDKNRILVWDCTTTTGTQQKTYEREISNNVYDRSIILRPYYTFERTATQHRYYCTHPDCAETSNAEASVWAEHVWETPDSKNPSVQYCKICNFCSQHTFAYTYSTTAHTATCVDCSCTVTENHDINESYNLTMHAHYCAECGYSVTASHAMETTNDSTSHWYRCTGCDYTNMNEAHTFTYSTYNLAKHRKTCSVCDYSELAPHLLSYSYDADGHWQECSLCSFETVSAAHNYVNSECTVCGRPQLIAMDIIAIPEEDEPLPVPEDQKATV